MPQAAVIVIGSGCAGLTAALYAARANLAPIVLEGPEPGGQLMWTTTVENFPGFPDGVMGPDLLDLMRRQAQRFGADTRFETVASADLSRRPFKVTTEADSYEAQSLIIASGASARLLGLPSEWHFMGYGVSTCATCDGSLYRGKNVAVVGGGDSAVEEATFLTRYAANVTLIHRREALRASKIMQDRLFSNPKIAYAWNSELEEVVGVDEPHKAVTGVRLKSTVNGSKSDLAVDGVFLAIGHTPNTGPFRDQVAMTPDGYLLTRAALAWKGVPAPAGLLEELPNYGSATSVEGVFAAGDVVDTHYRQAITAAGSGCAAAIDCEKWLEAQHAKVAHAPGAAAS